MLHATKKAKKVFTYLANSTIVTSSVYEVLEGKIAFIRYLPELQDNLLTKLTVKVFTLLTTNYF